MEQVRVRLRRVGVCGSDVHLYSGHRLLDNPNIIRHEGISYIDKIGAGVLSRSLGERVVVEPNIPCRTCRYCYAGRANICLNKRVVGAEYIVLPADFCWALPASDADAVTVEPAAVALFGV